MPTLVIAAGQASNTFALIDFTAPANPVVKKTPPGFSGACVVAIDDANAVVGNVLGDDISLFDVSNPANPSMTWTYKTVLSTIGAVAIRGNRIVVGEQNGTRVQLLDFSVPGPPRVIGTTSPLFGGVNTIVNSVVLLSSTIVFAAGPNDFRFARIDFSNPSNPAVTYVNPGFGGTGLTLDADPGTNLVAVAEAGGAGLGRIAEFNATTLIAAVTVATKIGSIDSVALSGHLALGGSNNAFQVARVDFTSSTVTTFDPQLGGGSAVALNGTLAALGGVTGNSVKLFDVSGPAFVPVGVAAPLGFAVQSVGLTVLNPVALLSPSSLAFGAVRAGTPKALTLAVRNTGNFPLNLSAITSSSPRFTSDKSSALVPPGGAVTMTVTFQPQAVGPVAANLTMNTNDPARPTVAVALSGTGGQPRITVSPVSVSLTGTVGGQAATSSVAIKNSGNVNLTVTSIAGSGPPFGVTAPTGAIAPGGNISATVQFTPTAAGIVNGTMTIASDDPTTPRSVVPLSGNGCAQAPVINIDGTNSLNSVLVDISAAPGASIYYTTDGTDPTASSSLYSGEFEVTYFPDGAATVKAIVIAPGCPNTAVASVDVPAPFQQVPTPIINVDGTDGPGSVLVDITVDFNATIYYTLDGSFPSRASYRYTGQFDVNDFSNGNVTLNAIAVAPRCTDSTMATALVWQP